MEQFLFSESNLSEGPNGKVSLFLDGDEHFHLYRVLRVRTGERILATDGAGRTMECVVREITKDRSFCEVVMEHTGLNSPPREFCIALSLLKPMSKVETALEKCTELGARKFLLFTSERSEKKKPRLDRLSAILKSAMKQSLRCYLPDLEFAGTLVEASDQTGSYDEKIVFHEKSSNMSAAYISKLSLERSVVAFIGPEGGFTDGEIAFLREKGFSDLSLGNARLRSETAAMSVASLLSVV